MSDTVRIVNFPSGCPWAETGRLQRLQGSQVVRICDSLFSPGAARSPMSPTNSTSVPIGSIVARKIMNVPTYCSILFSSGRTGVPRLAARDSTTVRSIAQSVDGTTSVQNRDEGRAVQRRHEAPTPWPESFLDGGRRRLRPPPARPAPYRLRIVGQLGRWPSIGGGRSMEGIQSSTASRERKTIGTLRHRLHHLMIPHRGSRSETSADA